jgi:hypothetical protein
MFLDRESGEHGARKFSQDGSRRWPKLRRSQKMTLVQDEFASRRLLSRCEIVLVTHETLS